MRRKKRSPETILHPYDLSRMLEGRRPNAIKLRAPAASVGAQAGYLKAMRVMLRGILKEFDAAYALSNGIDKFVTDAPSATFWEYLRRAADKLVSVATNTVNRIVNLESQRNTKQFVNIAKETLKIDLSAVVKQADLSAYLLQNATRNANLIKNISDDFISKIQEMVTQSTLNGESHAILWKKLAKQFGFSDRRAKLIARDQIGKLTADLNRARQLQAGITKYVWTTSLDERVRPLHQTLDGEIYDWGEPTGAEDGLPPGQPIQCRCLARPIIELGGKIYNEPTKQEIANRRTLQSKYNANIAKKRKTD